MNVPSGRDPILVEKLNVSSAKNVDPRQLYCRQITVDEPLFCNVMCGLALMKHLECHFGYVPDLCRMIAKAARRIRSPQP